MIIPLEKTINGKTIDYLYDSLDVIQEIKNGTVTANYIRTLNIDEPLARLTPNASHFYHQDALGSVIALTDDTGVVKTTYSYEPFGNVTISGEVSDNPFQYTGRENDGTGLYYYRARYYSPELQRFISEDPIGFEGGMNFYVYVGNNPVNLVDPYGLEPLIFNCSDDLSKMPCGTFYCCRKKNGNLHCGWGPKCPPPPELLFCGSIKASCTLACTSLGGNILQCQITCTKLKELVCPEEC